MRKASSGDEAFLYYYASRVVRLVSRAYVAVSPLAVVSSGYIGEVGTVT
jgi:hypothetical protein